MRSPCVRQCLLVQTAGQDRCAGCGRTLAEIAGWSRLSASERDRIMERLVAERPALR